MEGEKMFRATAFVGDHGRAYHRVEEVAVIDREGERLLYEDDRGSRQWTHSFVTFESMHPTREGAELWCADRLEAEAAPTLAIVAKLREQAAARVAQREVVSV